MLNEFVYCPRLFYYEFVEGVFVENADTLRGKGLHRRRAIDHQPLTINHPHLSAAPLRQDFRLGISNLRFEISAPSTINHRPSTTFSARAGRTVAAAGGRGAHAARRSEAEPR